MPFGRRQPIKCIETGDVFENKADAADHLGISRGSVQDSLRDGKSHRGYTFVYVTDLPDFAVSEMVQPEGDWQDIIGYEGLYQVSTTGAVWSCPRVVERCNGKPNTIRGKVIDVVIDDSGYCRVTLTDATHKAKKYLLHRLVAQTFIPNPDNKSEVNHIDGNKRNNRVDNLEWVTRYENQYHAVSSGLSSAWTSAHGKLMSDAALKVNNKPVLCLTTGETFVNRVTACRSLGLSHDAVSIAIKENRPYKGYMFKEITNG